MAEIPGEHDPEGSDAALDLLDIALRARAGTVSELAQLTTSADVPRLLRELGEMGYLAVVDGTLHYRRPELAAVAQARTSLDAAATELSRRLGQARRLFSSLPGLLEAWQVGAAAEQSLAVDVLHGADAPNESWRLAASREAPRSVCAVLPDVSRLLVPDAALLRRFQRRMRAGGGSGAAPGRLIISAADAGDPRVAERLRDETLSGIDVRMLPEPPSWFWVINDDAIGMPLSWGEAWPQSVMITRSAAVAEMMRWMFDGLWDRAVPVGEADTSWGTILALLNEGMTVDAAAYALGMSARTVRRRLAAAMEHFGVTSHFALGAAWAARDRGGAGV